ncbi:class C sortase [Bifidobacterium moukalabense]|uniref:class C sortase n=1 Tax=Bifidobacterium moukalabense TaxID=1333651 RepID=UPI0010F860A8|nr:class C sortase [Bifidobacterium moukalabense]
MAKPVAVERYDTLSFAEALDVSDVMHERRVLRRMSRVLAVFTVLLIGGGLLLGAYPLAMQWQSSRRQATQSAQVSQKVDDWPFPQARDRIRAAQEYNTRLAASGQQVLGEAVDPFDIANGSSQASSQSDSKASKDTEYQSLLDTGNGIMGAVEIPKINVNLPIYHGTGEDQLALGAGHLYGTSLPVGGTSTHTVITGHRGLVKALMFTRLDEMVEGDFIYLKVMGETLAYQVDDISIIKPDDTSKLRVVDGQDRLTLMTCTPYGVNTHRLLVSGHRVAIPEPAPDPTDLHDWRTIGIWSCAGILTVGWLLVWLVGRLRHGTWCRMRHATRIHIQHSGR